MFREDHTRPTGRKLWPEANDSSAVRFQDGPSSPKSAPSTPKRGLLPQEVTHVLFDDFGASPKPREAPTSPNSAARNRGSIGNPITGEPSASSAAGSSPSKPTGRKKTDLSSATWVSHVPFASNANDEPIPKPKPRGLKLTEFSARNYHGDDRPQYENPHHYTTSKNLQSPRSPKDAPFESNGTSAARTPRSPAHFDHMYDIMRDPDATRSKSAPTTPRRSPKPQQVSHVIFDDFTRPSHERPTSSSRARANLTTVNPLTAQTVSEPPAGQAAKSTGRGRTSQSDNAFRSTWKP
eukprot:TRINITY_DN5751_c0_g1_i1.p1 TRINITY_DN5751_c0_g1~~TRINITY_DN5751_c0_g1_i1.p1  ORF type:complete len:294 (+),score=59.93 TRINITY_DN5751_c0_g1_i1:115-996(+)